MNNISIRAMTGDDIAMAERFVAAAGWNQTRTDWTRLLDLQPHGCFVACCDGAIFGTATTVSYERKFGWIGMMLVDPQQRGGGIGTRLLHTAISYLEAQCMETIRLDATPQGKPLYEKAGFVREHDLERWEGVAAPQNDESTAESTFDFDLRPLEDADWPQLLAWDALAFGADRSRLLKLLHRDFPDFVTVAWRKNRIAGYIFGRRGALAHQVGPWLAADENVAKVLLQQQMAKWRGARVFIDAHGAQPHARAIVQSCGFTLQRPLTRMFRGPNRFPGEPSLTFGIAAPEVG